MLTIFSSLTEVLFALFLRQWLSPQDMRPLCLYFDFNGIVGLYNFFGLEGYKSSLYMYIYLTDIITKNLQKNYYENTA